MKKTVIFILIYIWIPIIISILAPAMTHNLGISIVILIGYSLCYFFVIEWFKEKKLRKKAEAKSIFRDPSILIKDSCLEADNDIIDKVYRYSLLSFNAEIDLEGNYKASYVSKGVNVSKKSSFFLLRKTGADSNVCSENLQMHALDLKTNEELKIDCLDDSPFVKKCKIHFRQPINVGQDFSVDWTFIWPHVLRKTGDYDGINLSRFKRGVDKVEWILSFAWELKAYSVIEINKNKEEDCSTQPIQSKDAKGHFIYKWTLEKPTADSYLFKYL